MKNTIVSFIFILFFTSCSSERSSELSISSSEDDSNNKEEFLPEPQEILLSDIHPSLANRNDLSAPFPDLLDFGFSSQRISLSFAQASKDEIEFFDNYRIEPRI